MFQPYPFLHKIIYLSAISLLLFIVFIQISCKNEPTIYAQRKNLIESVYASGKIIAENEHIIQSMDNGTVFQKFIQDGDTVKKGQLLYIINRETPSLKVQSKGKDADTKITPNTTLVVTKGSPVEERLYIRSDCDGVIYQSNKETGESVRSLEPLVLIGNKSNHLARLSVDQLDISKIKIGQLVLLKSDITGNVIYEGEVKRIYPLMNEANQTFRVDVGFMNKMDLPFIHNSIEGNIVIQKKENALVLPAYVLSEGDSVVIKTNNRQKKIKIKTGIKGVDFIEILEGIDEKTQVLVKSKK